MRKPGLSVYRKVFVGARMTNITVSSKCISVTAAIIQKDGLILAARRCDGGALDGYYEFPGGKIEPGERPRDCLKRELSEEFGVNCNIGPFVCESLYSYPDKNIRLMAYLASHESGEFELRDHSKILWLTRDELDTVEWAPADIPIVEAVKNVDNTILNNWYDENSCEYVDETYTYNVTDLCDRFLQYLGQHPNTQPEKSQPTPEKTHPLRILDGGCGSGRDSLYFQNRGCTVTSIDSSNEICKAAAEKSGISVECMRLGDVRWEQEFDGVWCCSSLLHIPKSDTPETLRKLMGTLKNGGVLYMSFKYGTRERFDAKGRFFNDYTEATIKEVIFSIDLPQGDSIEIIAIEKTQSLLRTSTQEWLNVFLRKTHKMTKGFYASSPSV